MLPNTLFDSDYRKATTQVQQPVSVKSSFVNIFMKMSGKEDKMKEMKPDRRTGKTRQSIYHALSDLMQEKKYSNITIQDIIDRANVGRSTFYAHFSTKDELLHGCVENIFEFLNHNIAASVEYTEQKTRILPVAELFEHVKENKRLIKGLMSVESEEFLRKIQSYWNKKIDQYLKPQIPDDREPKVPIHLLTNHISYTMIELLKWWVNNDTPYTAEQMDQYFQELINPCIASVLSDTDSV
jgi:AcrR family transcriptional regulator